MPWIFILLLLFVTYYDSAAQENLAAPCADGIDNDGDGLVDCYDPDCALLSDGGCVDCMQNGLSFADEVIDYWSACLDNPLNDPNQALALNNWKNPKDGKAVVLGEGGWIRLAFTNNIIANSGDNGPDIKIFEVGDVVEKCYVFLRPFDDFTRQAMRNAGRAELMDDFYSVGHINGDTTTIDIDFWLNGYPKESLKFDAIEIQDAPDLKCNTTINPGADIDAVCAITSMELDCAAIPNGKHKVDQCGNCRDINHPKFDSCLYRIYVPNAFSPNGDGLNDQFIIYPESGAEGMIMHLSIYNRWGQKILYKDKIQLTQNLEIWDGKINQEDRSSGLYFYHFLFQTTLGEEQWFDGSIKLLR